MIPTKPEWCNSHSGFFVGINGRFVAFLSSEKSGIIKRKGYYISFNVNGGDYNEETSY